MKAHSVDMTGRYWMLVGDLDLLRWFQLAAAGEDVDLLAARAQRGCSRWTYEEGWSGPPSTFTNDPTATGPPEQDGRRRTVRRDPEDDARARAWAKETRAKAERGELEDDSEYLADKMAEEVSRDDADP